MSPEESSLSSTPIPAKAAALNRWLAVLIGVSFLMFAVDFVLRAGIEATPSNTTDSAGRPMGFNDPLSGEHYLIILRHFEPAALFKPERAYEWLLLAMQATGAWLLLRARIPTRLTRWFFAVQPVLFPLGVLMCWCPPFALVNLFTGVQDREGFTDVPFVFSMAVLAHPTWVVCSVLIACKLHGPSLGFREFVRAARQSGLTLRDCLAAARVSS